GLPDRRWKVLYPHFATADKSRVLAELRMLAEFRVLAELRVFAEFRVFAETAVVAGIEPAHAPEAPTQLAWNVCLEDVLVRSGVVRLYPFCNRLRHRVSDVLGYAIVAARKTLDPCSSHLFDVFLDVVEVRRGDVSWFAARGRDVVLQEGVPTGRL